MSQQKRWSSPLVREHLSALRDAGTRQQSLSKLKQHVRSMEPSAIPRLMHHMSDPQDSSSSRIHGVALYEECARTHGPLIIPHIPRMMSSLIRSLSLHGGDLEFHRMCAKTVVELVMHASVTATQTEEVMDALCTPLSEKLLPQDGPSAVGVAVCLHSLVTSKKWKQASQVTQEFVFQKTVDALLDPRRSVPHLQLICVLARSTPHLLMVYSNSLVEIAEEVLTSSNSWQQRLYAIKLIQEVLTRCDQETFFMEVEDAITILEGAQADRMPRVQQECADALQIIRSLQKYWRPILLGRNNRNALAPVSSVSFPESSRFRSPSRRDHNLPPIRDSTPISRSGHSLQYQSPGFQSPNKFNPTSSKTRESRSADYKGSLVDVSSLGNSQQYGVGSETGHHGDHPPAGSAQLGESGETSTGSEEINGTGDSDVSSSLSAGSKLRAVNLSFGPQKLSNLVSREESIAGMETSLGGEEESIVVFENSHMQSSIAVQVRDNVHQTSNTEGREQEDEGNGFGIGELAKSQDRRCNGQDFANTPFYANGSVAKAGRRDSKSGSSSKSNGSPHRQGDGASECSGLLLSPSMRLTPRNSSARDSSEHRAQLTVQSLHRPMEEDEEFTVPTPRHLLMALQSGERDLDSPQLRISASPEAINNGTESPEANRLPTDHHDMSPSTKKALSSSSQRWQIADELGPLIDGDDNTCLSSVLTKAMMKARAKGSVDSGSGENHSLKGLQTSGASRNPGTRCQGKACSLSPEQKFGKEVGVLGNSKPQQIGGVHSEESSELSFQCVIRTRLVDEVPGAGGKDQVGAESKQESRNVTGPLTTGLPEYVESREFGMYDGIMGRLTMVQEGIEQVLRVCLLVILMFAGCMLLTALTRFQSSGQCELLPT